MECSQSVDADIQYNVQRGIWTHDLVIGSQTLPTTL